MQTKMNKILIITTKGCEGCYIAKENITAALTQTSKTIEVEDKDWHDIKRDFLHEHKIKDYPTVIYLVNGRIVHKSIGTYPIPVYLRWIDIYFKNNKK